MTDEESDRVEVVPSTDEPAKICTWNPAEEQHGEDEEVESSSFTTTSGSVNLADPTAQHPGGSDEGVVMAAAEVSAAVQVAGHPSFLLSNPQYKSYSAKKTPFEYLLSHIS